MMVQKQFTKAQALQKLRYYCAYQERCHSEAKDKLYQLGVRKKDQDEIISSLIQDNYLNEERFAIAFTGGKWRVNLWGKIKIRYELKQRGISEYCIKKSMIQIDEEEYLEIISKLANEKYASLKSDQRIVRKKKTIDYMSGKGFEAGLVNSALPK